MTSRTEYSTQTPKKSTLFSGQYLRIQLYMFRASSAHHQESLTVHTSSSFCVCVRPWHCLVRNSWSTYWNLLCGSHPLAALAVQIRWPKHSMAFLTYQSSCYLELQSTHELDIESVHTYILNTDGLEYGGWGADPWYHSASCPGPHNHPPLSAPFSIITYSMSQFTSVPLASLCLWPADKATTPKSI
jgi:hypothetical protein